MVKLAVGYSNNYCCISNSMPKIYVFSYNQGLAQYIYMYMHLKLFGCKCGLRKFSVFPTSIRA